MSGWICLNYIKPIIIVSKGSHFVQCVKKMKTSFCFSSHVLTLYSSANANIRSIVQCDLFDKFYAHSTDSG